MPEIMEQITAKRKELMARGKTKRAEVLGEKGVLGMGILTGKGLMGQNPLIKGELAESIRDKGLLPTIRAKMGREGAPAAEGVTVVTMEGEIPPEPAGVVPEKTLYLPPS